VDYLALTALTRSYCYQATGQKIDRRPTALLDICADLIAPNVALKK
jgi:hypothetical protein